MVKDETIVIRVDSKTKKDLIFLAKKSRRQLSDYLRILMDDAIKYSKTV